MSDELTKLRQDSKVLVLYHFDMARSDYEFQRTKHLNFALHIIELWKFIDAAYAAAPEQRANEEKVK